jgi:hypothetical protein
MLMSEWKKRLNGLEGSHVRIITKGGADIAGRLDEINDECIVLEVSLGKGPYWALIAMDQIAAVTYPTGRVR